MTICDLYYYCLIKTHQITTIQISLMLYLGKTATSLVILNIVKIQNVTILVKEPLKYYTNSHFNKSFGSPHHTRHLCNISHEKIVSSCLIDFLLVKIQITIALYDSTNSHKKLFRHAV